MKTSDTLFDRAAELRRDPKRIADLLGDTAARVLPMWRGLALIDDSDPDRGLRAVAATGAAAAGLAGGADHLIFLGLDQGAAVFAADLSGEPAEPELGLGGRFQPVREIAPLLPPAEAQLLYYARALAHWHERQRHCGACGAPTESRSGGHIRVCTAAGCAIEHFPRTDPAVIMLVTDGDRCLLGRQPSWPQGMHSCLAGFVEPGESFEEAVAREIFEESGIRVGDVRYFGSQPWPFPASIMIAFSARAIGGSLRIDPHELEDARWFSRAELDQFREHDLFLPRRDTIGRRVIEAWRAGRLRGIE